MPATPRWRARSARCRPRCIWCRPSPMSPRSTVADPDKLAYITQTTLSVDDTRGIIAALKARFPAIVGPGRARHLLCDAEPPAGGARPGRRGRHDPGGRLAQQLQLQPAARDRRGAGQAVLPDRRCRRAAGRSGSPASRSVGVTAGASAPETLVQGVLDGLRRFGEIDISTLAGVAEDVRFRFPTGTGRRIRGC